MRLVIARCQVGYAGRLTAHLPRPTRLLLVRAHGSVHSDDRADKPGYPGWRHLAVSVRQVFGAVRMLAGRSLVRGWAQ